jgi:leucyl-tRNA---protein transferase
LASAEQHDSRFDCSPDWFIATDSEKLTGSWGSLAYNSGNPLSDRNTGTVHFPDMETLFTYTAPPGPCGYLPSKTWQLRYEIVRGLTPADYSARMNQGWRKFGHTLFRPECVGCKACLPLRVDVKQFRPGRNLNRVRNLNEGRVRLAIGTPVVTDEKLRLYDAFHAFQADFKGWPERGPESSENYADSFVENPFETEEWCYYRDDRLIGVGYVDAVPDGLSMIYFYYDPTERDHSPGTWNVLCALAEAKCRNLPHVYMGYFVEGCGSLEYKARFTPNEILDWTTGLWIPFRA